MRKLATKKGNVEGEGAWVDSWDKWCLEGREEKEEVLRLRAGMVVLGRFLVQEGQNDEV